MLRPTNATTCNAASFGTCLQLTLLHTMKALLLLTLYVLLHPCTRSCTCEAIPAQTSHTIVNAAAASACTNLGCHSGICQPKSR